MRALEMAQLLIMAECHVVKVGFSDSLVSLLYRRQVQVLTDVSIRLIHANDARWSSSDAECGEAVILLIPRHCHSCPTYPSELGADAQVLCVTCPGADAVDVARMHLLSTRAIKPPFLLHHMTLDGLLH
jgi:hypothetical protein